MQQRTLTIVASASLVLLAGGAVLCSRRSHAPVESPAAATAPSATSSAAPIAASAHAVVNRLLPPELQAFDTWVDSALAAIAKQPGPTSTAAPHPVLGSIQCHTGQKPPSGGLCISTRIVQRGQTKSVYSAKWKRDDPSVWTVATTAQYAPSLDCKRLASGSASTVGRINDASGTRIHCKLGPDRQALISQYASAATHRRTNLVYFSPSFAAVQPGFQRLLSPGPQR